MIFYTTTWRKILTITGIAVLTSSVYLSDAQAQSFTDSGSLLISQNLGGIVRKIPLEEVALPAMSSAKTPTNAAFSQARIEQKLDGSLIYIASPFRALLFHSPKNRDFVGVVPRVPTPPPTI